MSRPMPVRRSMCETCPFRANSKTAYLAESIANSARFEAIRICHNTGSYNAFHRRTGKPRAACAGARRIQLDFVARMGLIAAPTEKAWQKKCDFYGIRNGISGTI